jgi:protoporphyrinogen oxidase
MLEAERVDAQVGILGAGASGLSLALLTHLDWLLLEADVRPGGHAVSTKVDGWTFDRGPHIMFSRRQLLLDCMVASLGENVHQCRRNNRVAIAGGLARYPIENDLVALPLPLRSDALLSFLGAQRGTEEPRNLAEWFRAHFGEVLVSEYFRPYNEKVWNVPLEQLSMSWADRIPKPPLEDVVRGALGESSEGYLHQLYYSYPLVGGYGALTEAWASALPDDRVVLDCRVERIEPTEDGVTVHTAAKSWSFGQVVSTLPLHDLVDIVAGVPKSVREAVAQLIVNPMLVVTLGFSGFDPNQYTAVYIPDDDFLVNRVSYPAVFSPQNAPAGCFSVQAEITTTRGADLLSWSDESVLEHVVRGLEARSLIPDEAQLIFRQVDRYDLAYVVYTENYERHLEVTRNWFKGQGILLHGRFGAHAYLNVDGCLESSIDLARYLGADLPDAAVLERFRRLDEVR